MGVLIIGMFFILVSGLFGFSQKKIQSYSLLITLVSFLIVVFIWVFFDRLLFSYQYLIKTLIYIDNTVLFGSVFWYVNRFFLSFGIDGVSLFFIVLSVFLVPLCLLTSWKKNMLQIKEYCFYFLILEFLLILSFAALDLISFFIFFETILIPMFFIIGVWGSRERRIKATFIFFLYTLAGSVFLFFALLIVYYDIGSTSFCILMLVNIEFEKGLVLWLFIYISLSVKIPTIPCHIWLPEAHVEAPTAGSVILAGLLLKLGGYGFCRVLITVFSGSTIFYLPMVEMFAVISIVYASLTTIRQLDLKRVIAYSSIAHMNLVVLGLFSGNIQGIAGSIFLMVAHGIVSSALFFIVGVLYDKYGTRLLCCYGGLSRVMPVFSIYLLLFCLANIGLPGTCNFVGEIVVFAGLVDKNFFVFIVAVTGVVFSVVYTIFFFNRLVFGNLNLVYISVFKDITKREVAILIPLLIMTFVLGFFPDLVFDTILVSVSTLVEKSKVF